MKWLRLHITRITMVLLVGSGFGLFLIQPANSHQKTDALVNCVEQMTKLPETSDVKKELAALQKSSAGFRQLVERATQIINRNPQAFNASLVDLAVSSHLYQLLFSGWNELKAGSDINGLLRLSIVNSFWSVQNTKANLLNSFGLRSDFLQVLKRLTKRVRSFVISLRMLRIAFSHPMSSGIAIGAP